MDKFLITAIGGDLSQGIAKILKNNYKKIKIIGCDIAATHAGTNYVDTFFKISKKDKKKKYLNELKIAIKKYKVNYLIAGSEKELELISQQSEFFSYCQFISAGKKAIKICLDKYKTKLFLDKLGHKSPWTLLSKNNLPLSYPCIFKKRKGSGAKIFYIVKNKKEALFLSKRYKDSLFQELLSPENKEITCAVFRSKDGKVSVLQLNRKLTGGFTSWAEVIYSKDIEKICRKIAIALDLVGSLNIQLIITKDGARIFEINPRFSSTLYMRSLIGFDDLIWSIKDKKNIKIIYPKIKTGIKLAKTYSAVKLK